MASELQKKKLNHLFRTFYDFNHDGKIDWVDFEECLSKVAGIHKRDMHADKVKRIMETSQKVWKGLEKIADTNKNNEISPEEWLTMWEEVLKSQGGKLPDWHREYCHLFFDISDTSGDEIVDLDEYTTVYTNFGFTADQCKECFDKFTDGGKIKVTKEIFESLWNDYILSSDANAKGNFLFGPY